MRVNCNPQDDNKSGSIFNVIAEKWRDEEFGSILAVFIAHRKVHEKKLQNKQQILTPEGNIEDINKREINTKIYMVHQKC